MNNTDAEGRLILADALTYCVRELGADRLVDLATLTGAVLVALGSTYAALISNDDEWAQRVLAAGERTGELAWRLPLHPEYKELTRGKDADLTNASAKRKAGTIYAGSFLEEFVDGKPWAHLDIAGTAWDVGREYVGSGPTGFGVRLLVALARELAPETSPKLGLDCHGPHDSGRRPHVESRPSRNLHWGMPWMRKTNRAASASPRVSPWSWRTRSRRVRSGRRFASSAERRVAGLA